MLGLGWSEMLVIAVVVLIVVGPKDLPVMLRNLGRMMGSVRRMSNDFRREIDKAIAADEIKEAKKAISDPLKQTTADITKEFNSIRDGKVEPSGKLKPGTEGQESVYEEIRAQAGITGDKAAAPSAASASIRAKIAEQQAQAKASTAAVEDKPAPVRAAAKPRSVAANKATASKATTSKASSGTAKPARSAKASASAATSKSSAKTSAKPKKAQAAASKPTKASAEAASPHQPTSDAAPRAKSAKAKPAPKAKAAPKAESKPAKAKP